MANYGKPAKYRRKRGALCARLCLEQLEPRELLAVGLDLSFGHNGLVNTALGDSVKAYDRAKVAESPDGKIVVATTAWSAQGTQEVIALRLLADGALDLSFGTGGEVVLPFVEMHSWSFPTDDLALVVQPDGKILLGGSAETSPPNSYSPTFALALERLNVDGSADATFGHGGAVITAVSHTDSFGGMSLEADGKIVLVGTAHFGLDFTSSYKQGFEVVRYNPNGSLDTSFSGIGETTTYIDGRISDGLAVAVQPDDRIVAAGSAFGELTLIRYNADGTLDNGFGVGGKVINQSIDLINQDTAAVLPNGDLVIGGFHLVAWYDSRGNLLNLRTDVPGDVSSFGIAPNGDLLAGGQGGHRDSRHP